VCLPPDGRRASANALPDIRTFDTPSMLHPFLQVIRSSSTSAPITSLALIAITKFLSYNVVGRDSPRLPEAMQQLSSAITHCRFEASDSPADEIVLLRILKLMESMVSGQAGEVLGDESICEMMETGLSMCCQSRLSELLRRSAEIAMVSMCHVIFKRLKTLEIEFPEELQKLDEELDKDDKPDGLKMDPTTNGESDGAPTKVRRKVKAIPTATPRTRIEARLTSRGPSRQSSKDPWRSNHTHCLQSESCSESWSTCSIHTTGCTLILCVSWLCALSMSRLRWPAHRSRTTPASPTWPRTRFAGIFSN
jgi:hypothetical protein